MKRRWIGYAVWMGLTGCLYFFENNTGTRIVLLCSVIFPMLPFLRRAFFALDEIAEETAPKTLTVWVFMHQEEEESGSVRPYVPGDLLRRIHWKLSVKKDELLVRETAGGAETAEEKKVFYPFKRKRKTRKKAAAVSAAGILICLILILLIPEALRGVQALCNRLFAESEKVNSYIYERFNVPENQNLLPAGVLLSAILVLALMLTVTLRSRPAVLGIMAACTLFQVYFGLTFPIWIIVPLYGLFGLLLMRRPFSAKCLLSSGICLLMILLAVAFFVPGVDPETETASEKIRDRLARLAEQITGTAAEMPEGETETRHIHSRSMENGNREAETEREFRLVTVEEAQISMPRRIDWIRAAWLLLLAAVSVILPFAPFLLLNARKKKAQEIRRIFVSQDIREAVRMIFRQTVLWLEATGRGGGNRLYREWGNLLQEGFPEGYSDRFVCCAADYEEALYSDHPMSEEKRRNALDLLKETEGTLWKTAGWKQRFYLKYWMCLYE